MQVEDYFRDVRDADVQLLAPRPPLEQDPQLAVPRLGQPYRQVWQEEDAAQQRSSGAAQQKQSATVAKQKLLSASPVSKAKKRLATEMSSAPLVTSVVRRIHFREPVSCFALLRHRRSSLRIITPEP